MAIDRSCQKFKVFTRHSPDDLRNSLIGIHLGSGIVSAIIHSVLGTVILLLVVHLIRGRGRF